MVNKYAIGILVLVLLTASIYILIPENVRIDVGKTYSTFKVWENDSWVLAGQEYSLMFDGTTKMRASSRTVESFVDGNIVTIIRTANFKNNVTVIDTYTFDGDEKDIKLFPISHEINVLNGEGYILVYEVTKLEYSGETIKEIDSPQKFGHNMKIEWEDGNYYSRIWGYANKDEGKLTIKYRPDSADFTKQVRLFDPPSEDIGYEFLDEGEVVHIWNTQDDYFFDKNSGIQLTNHYEDYWTKNIFCIGYYNNNEWHKIKCSDELTNFHKSIETDNQTFVNATLWKDIYFGSYDFRLGVRYNLGLNDENLSISIYGKNIGTDIPFDLGFAWKVTDINIPDSNGKSQSYGDSIEINNIRYKLEEFNDTLLFKNMSHTYTNWTYEEGKEINNGLVTEYDSHLRMQDWTEYLRIDWNKNLNYAVKMFGNGNQEDFYVALLINAGLFNSGDEKSTTFQWIDVEGDYIDSFSTSGETNYPYGITTYGNYLWISDVNDDEVYRYYTNGTYVDSFDTYAIGNREPYGITTDGTNIWILDKEDEEVYKYQMDGDYVSSFDTSAQPNWGMGITTDGTYFWIVNPYEDEVYKYYINGTYISSWNTDVQSTNPYGITTYGNYFWISDVISDEVYKYYINGTYTDEHWDTSGSGNTYPYDITTNGNYFWVIDYADKVYRYELVLPDETPPTYSNNQTNTTIAGELCNFSIDYNDDTALHPDGTYIFSTNNSGVWVNESAVNFTSTPETISVIKTLNSTSGLTIGYRWYANDSAGNNNNTEIFTLTTTSADTCTCPGAGNNWEVNMEDECHLIEACNIGTGNLSWIGSSGYFNCSANLNLTNRDAPPSSTIFYFSDGCEVIHLIILIFISTSIFKKRKVLDLIWK